MAGRWPLRALAGALAGGMLIVCGPLARAQLTTASAATPVAQVFLVQNSGWMEPFYSDPASQYKALITELVLAATRPGDAMVLAAFNQSLPDAPSPRALLALQVTAPPRAQVTAALAGLDTATKPGTTALADTDLQEALSAAIGTALAGKPGLVWLFTNNKNSPNNDQATARRNREFYRLIHQGAAIRTALAFPLHMPVRGRHYQASGLMVYVFAIGEQGARQLDALLDTGRIHTVISETPARLKPLDRDTVRLAPAKVADAPGVRFSMAPGGMLVADVEAGASAPAASMVWKLENRVYPYTIASATLSARSALAGQDQPITLDNDQVRNLAPGASAPLAAVLRLPVAQLPSKWSAQAIGSAGSAYVLPGKIALQLREQKLELSQAFTSRMAALFPGDPLPDIFTPPARVQGSQALLPIEVRVHFGLAPLLTLIGAVLALLAALAGALVALTRPRKVLLTVDGEARTVTTRPGTRYPVYDQAGAQVAQLESGWFGHRLAHLREGAQVRLGR
ncbi:MAG: hypothetical protein V4754_19210 [Pseudomonadota bacterium]